MATTYKYLNLKKETDSSGKVDLIQIKKPGRNSHKRGKTLRELVMEGFAEVNKQLANQQQSINELKTDVNQLKSDVNQLKIDVDTLKTDVNQLKIDSKNTKDLLIDVIKTNDLKVSNSELIEQEDEGMEK